MSVTAEIYSPPYWGNVVASILTGVSVSQYYVFMLTSSDHWRIKGAITFLVCCAVASTFVSSLYIRDVLIDSNQNPEALINIPRYFFVVIIFDEITPPLVQAFIAMQIYFMNRKWLPLSIAIWVCALVEIGIGLWLSHWTSTLRNLLEVHASKNQIVAGVWNGVAGFVDILATIGLCMLLKSVKTSFRTTKDLINYLVAIFANRGLLLIIFQFLFVAFWFGSPTTLLWLPMYLILNKLYVVTLLAILNMRQFVRERAAANNSHSMGTFSYSRGGGVGSRVGGAEDLEHGSTVQGVKVSRVTELTFDGGYEGAPMKHDELGRSV